MRLLYGSRDYTTHDLRFVRAFVGAGMEVHYARLESDGVPYVREGLPPGARWVDWGGGGAPQPAARAVEALSGAFADLVAKLRPDLIHAGPVQTLGLMAVQAALAPTVLVSWGSDVLVDADRDPWYRSATRAALLGSQAFVCDSGSVRARASELADGWLPPWVCVPWGPDELPGPQDPERRAAARSALGWTDAVVVVTSRAWHPEYRVPALVDAFAEAARSVPALRLALAGHGPDAGLVEARIAHHGIDSLVFRPGVLERARLYGLFEAADLYLSLVPSDGTSIALLEAMAHGLPPVVTRNVGNAEWVEPGVNGWLVGPETGPAWSGTLTEAARDLTHLRLLGRAARDTVIARADWRQNSAKLVELYRATARQVPGGTTGRPGR